MRLTRPRWADVIGHGGSGLMAVLVGFSTATAWAPALFIVGGGLLAQALCDLLILPEYRLMVDEALKAAGYRVATFADALVMARREFFSREDEGEGEDEQ